MNNSNTFPTTATNICKICGLPGETECTEQANCLNVSMMDEIKLASVKRPRNYPATRRGNKTGPKSRFKDGSQNWTVRIPKDPTQAEECKRLIRLVIQRYAVGAVIVR
jgi:hypothetical protein